MVGSGVEIPPSWAARRAGDGEPIHVCITDFMQVHFNSIFFIFMREAKT